VKEPGIEAAFRREWWKASDTDLSLNRIACQTGGASDSTARDTLKAYLRMKVEQEDWHGVWDAAIDLALMDAKEKE
jgi:phage terminase large subunit GpA-like protein